MEELVTVGGHRVGRMVAPHDAVAEYTLVDFGRPVPRVVAHVYEEGNRLIAVFNEPLARRSSRGWTPALERALFQATIEVVEGFKEQAGNVLEVVFDPATDQQTGEKVRVHDG